MQKFFEYIWYKNALPAFIFLPFTLLFIALAAIRRTWLKAIVKKQLDIPVIVVGNITVGGTGKTPVVIALVEALVEKGFKPGVISRGYGANITVPQLLDANSKATQVGDEPLLIYQRTGKPVVVCPDRLASAEMLASLGVNVIISDDGLQHYKLFRDIEVVVVDGKRGLGNGLRLPAGPLRESRARIKQADFVVVNGGSKQPLLPSQIDMQLEASPIKSLVTGLIADIPKGKVHAVAGIGNPERFFNTLENLGYEPIRHSFPDHHAFKESDIQFGDGLPVIMTEKDAVKCIQLTQQDHYYYLPVDAHLPESFWQGIHEKLQR